MIELRELTLQDEEAFYTMLNGWDDSSGFILAYGLLEDMGFESYLKMLEESKQGINLPGDHVPSTSFFAFKSDEIVGRVSIRHKLNESLLQIGGHIGYGVMPIHRGKGYASSMLKFSLDYCKILGLYRVLITCDETNLASRRVILKNGGIFENMYRSKMRYWISLNQK